MARFTLDPHDPPQLSAADKARLDALTDADINVAAENDADNRPLTDEELERLRALRRVRDVRAHTGLSQTVFARTFHINVARLRDLEQGRAKPVSTMLAYLAVIDREPDAVRRALETANLGAVSPPPAG